MLELAHIEPQHQVSEPTCGKGDIVAALKEFEPGLAAHDIGQNRAPSDVLSAKGHEVVFGDFLEHNGCHDRLVMNPPVEKGKDIEHVQYAYSL